MPITSHVSLIESPFAERSTNPWMILGFAGSLVSIAWQPNRVHTGVKLPNDLRPVIVYPPSTRSALVVEENSDVSLPLSAWPAANTSPGR